MYIPPAIIRSLLRNFDFVSIFSSLGLSFFTSVLIDEENYHKQQKRHERTTHDGSHVEKKIQLYWLRSSSVVLILQARITNVDKH